MLFFFIFHSFIFYIFSLRNRRAAKLDLAEVLYSNAERGKRGGGGGGGERERGKKGGIQVDACFDREVILVP